MHRVLHAAPIRTC